MWFLLLDKNFISTVTQAGFAFNNLLDFHTQLWYIICKSLCDAAVSSTLLNELICVKHSVQCLAHNKVLKSADGACHTGRNKAKSKGGQRHTVSSRWISERPPEVGTYSPFFQAPSSFCKHPAPDATQQAHFPKRQGSRMLQSTTKATPNPRPCQNPTLCPAREPGLQSLPTTN